MNPKHIYQLFVFYPIHICSIIGLFLVDYHAIDFIFFFVGCVLIHGLGAEVTLHRYISHRSFQPKSYLKIPLLILATLSIQGGLLGWANVHRKHHRYSDTAQDPHSPVRGKFYAWHLWTKDWPSLKTKSDIKNIRDILKDKDIVTITRLSYYIIFMIYLLVGVFNLEILYFMFMLPATFGLIQSYNVNLFCHLPYLGYKSNNTKDDSRNNLLLGFTTWGLGFHNNHHAHPASIDYSGKKFFEYDLAGKILIPLVKK